MNALKVRRLECPQGIRCLARSYLLVFVVNATATGLLWPADLQDNDFPCELKMRLFFFGLMLSSFGAGCVAAFMVRRAEASSHTKMTCGYAIVNWIQSILASLGMTNPVEGHCRYGVIPGPALGGRQWYEGIAGGRMVLYIFAACWMQRLILFRLDLLEQSSKQNFGRGRLRSLIRAQWILTMPVFSVMLSVLCVMRLIGIEEDTLMASGWIFVGIQAGIMWLCHVAASTVAIASFHKIFLELRGMCRLAEGNEASISARSSLSRGRRFAGLQGMGISFSLVFTLLLVPACLVSMFLAHRGYDTLELVCFFIQAFDPLLNAVAVLLLSGSHRMAKVERSQGSQGSWKVKKPSPHSSDAQTSQTSQSSHEDVTWNRKVKELSMRGMTLRSLLQFYQDQLPLVPHTAHVEKKVEEKREMGWSWLWPFQSQEESVEETIETTQDWKYSPKEHKTKDVVRRAIIPLTSREECAFSVSSFNTDGPKRAQVMVTHNWGNLFSDLLAAVLSDALQEHSFSLPARLMQEDCAFLQDLLGKMRRLDTTYWICAFAVNQHVSICHSNPYDRDPFTNQLHPVCHCSSTNIEDLDGRSASSEINKFDDMMCLLSTTGGCRQVIAVDQSLDLFRRAWCVAEIAEAKRLQMDQSLKLLSKATLQVRARTLGNLDVRDMQASSEKDKELILGKIQDVDDFNAKLQVLIFDPKSGLVATWNAMDSLQQTGEVGRLIRWGLADAGTGKVWKNWEG